MTTKQVVIIGAGMSGLCMGVQLKQQGINDFVILERSDDVAGTWNYNTYPGCGCDVPSVFYSYSFYLNPNWSRVYSLHDEIKQYFRDCAVHFGLNDHIQFNTEVERADYDEERGSWTVTTKGGETIESRVLVSGLGQLNVPFTPDFDGSHELPVFAFGTVDDWAVHVTVRDIRPGTDDTVELICEEHLTEIWDDIDNAPS